MKRFLLVSICPAIFGVTVVAQDDADYQNWMKTVGAAGSLRGGRKIR